MEHGVEPRIIRSPARRNVLHQAYVTVYSYYRSVDPDGGKASLVHTARAIITESACLGGRCTL